MSNEIQPVTTKNGPGTWPWIWAILGFLYAVSPLDILPDAIPIVGWVDDLAIFGTSILNLIQAHVDQTHSMLAKILGLCKWGIITLGVIAILLILLIGGLAYSIFAK